MEARIPTNKKSRDFSQWQSLSILNWGMKILSNKIDQILQSDLVWAINIYIYYIYIPFQGQTSIKKGHYKESGIYIQFKTENISLDPSNRTPADLRIAMHRRSRSQHRIEKKVGMCLLIPGSVFFWNLVVARILENSGTFIPGIHVCMYLFNMTKRILERDGMKGSPYMCWHVYIQPSFI